MPTLQQNHSDIQQIRKSSAGCRGHGYRRHWYPCAGNTGLATTLRVGWKVTARVRTGVTQGATMTGGGQATKVTGTLGAQKFPRPPCTGHPHVTTRGDHVL